MPPLDDSSVSAEERGSQVGPSGLDRAAVLAAVGQVRECLAAARNLEHLVASINVGPKVIVQVLPDVAGLLERFPTAVDRLLDALEPHLRLAPTEREQLSRMAAAELMGLLATLKRADGVRMQARQRLEIERQLRQAVPRAVSVVSHCELLVEAVNAVPVRSSLRDLLSMISDRRSDRPWQRVPVAGDLDVVSLIPPRTALLALAAYASHGAEGSRQAPVPALLITERAGEAGLSVEVSLCTAQPGSLQASLPIFAAHQVTPSVVGAALRIHGGAWTERCLLLPGPGSPRAS